MVIPTEQISISYKVRFGWRNHEGERGRLQHLRSAQEQRIAVESTDEREARVQRVRSAQEQRIAAESTDEREARLQ